MKFLLGHVFTVKYISFEQIDMHVCYTEVRSPLTRSGACGESAKPKLNKSLRLQNN